LKSFCGVGQLDFKTAKDIIESLKKKPITTFCILVGLVILFIGVMYFGGFLTEKGKQLAVPSQEIRGVSPPSKAEQQQLESADQSRDKGQGLSTPPKVVQQQPKKLKQPDTAQKASPQTEGDQSPIIIQETKGDQSPAVIVGPGGSSTINYGATPKDKKAKE
jgi:hypothetical protein